MPKALTTVTSTMIFQATAIIFNSARGKSKVPHQDRAQNSANAVGQDSGKHIRVRSKRQDTAALQTWSPLPA
jgi:hypothetical protein